MKNLNLNCNSTAYKEFWRVLVWPCGIALVTFCMATLGCRMDFTSAMATATLAAAGLIALRMLLQIAPQFTPNEWHLLSVSTALLFWCWCGATGHFLAASFQLPVARVLGLVFPPLALIHYLNQQGGKPRPTDEHLMEGTSRQLQSDITRRWKHREKNVAELLPHVCIAGLQFPTEAIRKYNLLLIGALGSGKTTILKQFMQSVISKMHPDGRLRAVVYDASTELVPFIEAIRQDETPAYIMNPYDERAYAWDIAADVQTVRDATSIARALVPHRTGSTENEYFTRMSRLLTKSAILGLARTRGEDWDLADVVFTILDKSWWEPVLRQTRSGRTVLDNLGSDETSRNVVSAVVSFFDELMPIVSLMRHHAAAGRKLSIKNWNRTASVLILGQGDGKGDPVSAFNRILIERLQRQLLNFHTNPRNEDNRTFLFLDEFADFGPLHAIRTLMRTGRKYGVCTTLAFQTIADLQTAYARDSEWQSIIGQVGNKIFLRMQDHQTAEWASKEIGKQPVDPPKQISKDTTTGRQSITETEGGPPQYDFVIQPIRFQSLPLADVGGVQGFARFGISTIVSEIQVALEDVTGFPTSDEPAFIECPADWQEADEEPVGPPANGEAALTEQSDDEHFHALMESLKRFS